MSRMRRFSTAGKRPPPSCWTGCRGWRRAQACWWCRVCRERASRRCCERECCRGFGGQGWPRRRVRRRGRAWCSPRPARRWMSWHCGWRCWREPMRQLCGVAWTPTRAGSRSPPVRLPWLRRRCPARGHAVQDRYLVTSMTDRQLRMAITEPAKTAGSRVDDDLVEVLLAELRTRQPGVAGAGVLPLLSHALDQAWRSRTGEVLSLADYERTGGIEGAVADSAQRAYDLLTPGQQAAARQVFTRLTAAGSDGMDTADRATQAELTEGMGPAGDVAAVLEAFAAERLLTLAADSVEISHEVLLTAWPLLRDTWLTETHADRMVRTRLHHTAVEWARYSRDPSYLYSGSLLQAAAETAARIGADPARYPPFSQTERDFLQASGRARRRS